MVWTFGPFKSSTIELDFGFALVMACQIAIGTFHGTCVVEAPNEVTALITPNGVETMNACEIMAFASLNLEVAFGHSFETGHFNQFTDISRSR